jgi:hypothetical protein
VLELLGILPDDKQHIVANFLRDIELPKLGVEVISQMGFIATIQRIKSCAIAHGDLANQDIVIHIDSLYIC